jgi:uncharacterized protein (UPF0335 family)
VDFINLPSEPIYELIMNEVIIDGVSGSILRQYIERIEKLESEKTDILTQIKEVYDEARSEGLEPKIMKQVIKVRKMKKEDLDEQETLLEVYKRALGMDSKLD